MNVVMLIRREDEALSGNVPNDDKNKSLRNIKSVYVNGTYLHVCYRNPSDMYILLNVIS